MVNRNLLRQFDRDDDAELAEIFGNDPDALASWLPADEQNYQSNKIVQGKVLEIRGDMVVIDIGYKSEGLIALDEWRDEAGTATPPKAGDSVEVLLETLEGEDGTIALSYRKAKRQKEWEAILAKHKEGDVVSGPVTKKIKGGLLVQIGVNVFLPASQVDIRRPQNIDEYIGQTIECLILKIDEQRRNIVVSRRKLIEIRRDGQRAKLMTELEVGQIRKGIVKNIADFGAFVDLGGIDGLLHITDMSWGRINHPSDMLKMGQKVEVKVLGIDREKEKIALGLKQKETSPWEEIEKKYPVGSRVKGEVVNIMSYGAFVRLEPGIEGLVHISEMSWTRRVNHPSEVVQPGNPVEVVVLDINKEKLEISLGMKQTEVNPWELVGEKYPPGTVIEGTVRNLANYGAFVEIEPGIDGLLHVSDVSWTKKITHPNEVFKKGDKVRCVVLDVDREKQRVALGLKQLTEDPWLHAIPDAYKPGMVVRGKVTKITNFGVFVELEAELEGLLHISELADHKVENPQDVVKPNDEVDVKILRVDMEDRKIGLSLKRAQWGDTAGADRTGETPEEDRPGKSKQPKRGGMDDHGAMGTDKIVLGSKEPLA